MSVDETTVRKVAKLARIAVSDDEVGPLTADLNRILGFVEQLDAVDVAGVEPMTAVTPLRLKRREDVVTEGGRADANLAAAPETAEGFYVVPKVVE